MREEEQYIREHWFNDHQAYHSRYICEKESWPSPIEHLIWSTPTGGYNDIEYWDTHGILTVRGDLGVAVYQWDTLKREMSRWTLLGLEQFADKNTLREYGPRHNNTENVHINCHAHLIGLKMAFEQLKKK
jgi:hypothetical protein